MFVTLRAQVDGAGFRTKSILCMPIRNAQHTVIGVAKFVNKLDETAFNENDENLFEVRTVRAAGAWSEFR